MADYVYSLAGLFTPISIIAAVLGGLAVIALFTQLRRHPMVRVALVLLPSGVLSWAANSGYAAAFQSEHLKVLGADHTAGHDVDLGSVTSLWVTGITASALWPALFFVLARRARLLGRVG